MTTCLILIVHTHIHTYIYQHRLHSVSDGVEAADEGTPESWPKFLGERLIVLVILSFVVSTINQVRFFSRLLLSRWFCYLGWLVVNLCCES
jgi:hypothetical protein